jgi:ABC-type branched-subunit amino acid transport system substrate-binding protein
MERGRGTIYRLNFTAATAATAAVAAVMAACGISLDSTNHNSGQECTAPGVTADTIKLGLLYPDSGPASEAFAAYRAGVDARLGMVNAAGGVHHRRLTYAWEDDESSPDVNRVGASALVDEEKVFGIIETTSVATGSARFLHDRGVPVTGVAVEPVWNDNDNMFTFLNYAGLDSVSTWGDYVTSHGGRNALILRLDFSESMRLQAEKMSASLQAAGVNVAGIIDLVPDSLLLSGLGTQIMASGADTVVGLLPPDMFNEAVISARAAGVKLNTAMSFGPGYDQSLLQNYGRQIADVSYYLGYSPFELHTPGHTRFLTAMAAYAPQLQPPTNGGAVSGWIAADMMVRGLQEAGDCPTRNQFIERLRAVDDYSADGLLPAQLNIGASFGQSTRCFTFVQVSHDGTRFDVTQPAPRCGQPI